MILKTGAPFCLNQVKASVGRVIILTDNGDADAVGTLRTPSTFCNFLAGSLLCTAFEVGGGDCVERNEARLATEFDPSACDDEMPVGATGGACTGTRAGVCPCATAES